MGAQNESRKKCYAFCDAFFDVVKKRDKNDASRAWSIVFRLIFNKTTKKAHECQWIGWQTKRNDTAKKRKRKTQINAEKLSDIVPMFGLSECHASNWHIEREKYTQKQRIESRMWLLISKLIVFFSIHFGTISMHSFSHFPRSSHRRAHRLTCFVRYHLCVCALTSNRKTEYGLAP